MRLLTWAGLVWVRRPDPTVGWGTVVLEFLVAGPADSCMRPCEHWSRARLLLACFVGDFGGSSALKTRR